MSIYRIERREIYPDKIRSSIIGRNFTSLDECDQKIKDYAEAWRKEAWLIHHHDGQSKVFFDGYYVEFTRLSSSQTILIT